MRSWIGQMTAKQSRVFAEEIVIPALLPAMGLTGKLVRIEQIDQNVAAALDILGGIDFWVRTDDKRLIGIASRNQWHKDDEHKRDSFTVRVDIGGPKTEAHKRVLAIKEGGIIPEWTVQGYITKDLGATFGGRLHHAGAIKTRELFAGFLEAAHQHDFKTWCNPADGHEFWAGFWPTLSRYGHGETLRTIDGIATVV